MIKNKIRKPLSLLLSIFLLFSVGCAPKSSSTDIAPPTPTAAAAKVALAEGKIALKHLLNLSDGIGARQEGTPATGVTTMYIKGELKKLGYEPTVQAFSGRGIRKETQVPFQSENIIVEKPGKSDKVLVLGAHYDSVELGDGAADNGSGVAVLLELAERLKTIETPYTLRFIFFGAEEDGLIGSRYYVSSLSPTDLKKIVHMVNFDTLISGNKQYVYGDFGDKGILRNLALDAAKEMNLPLITQSGTKEYPAGTTGPFSDHVPFEEKKIPYTYFESTDWALGQKDGYTQVDEKYGATGEIWHSTYDTLEYINKTFPGRIEMQLELFVKVIMKVLPEFRQ